MMQLVAAPNRSTSMKSALAARATRLTDVALVVVLTVAAGLGVGPGFAGYDATWALVWGRQIAHGQMPEFEAPRAPTPHPLANAVSTLLAPLPPELAQTAIVGISWLGLAALAWGALCLGEVLFGRAVGLLTAAIVATRAAIPLYAAQAFVDVPFLALVVWAAALEVRRPRLDLRVPALLLLAGLLRPEAWPLAIGYAIWALPAQPASRRWKTASLLVAAPLLWAATDVLVTGDPLFSLHGTQTLAEQLNRPRGVSTALTTTPERLLQLVQGTAGRVALAGVAVGLLWRRQASALPFGLLAVGIAGYLVLGLAGLPLRERYLMIPVVVLSLFAAVAALGWITLPAAHPRRRTWQFGGAVAGALVALGIPGDLDRLHQARARLEPHREMRADVVSATREPAVAGAIQRCQGVRIADGYLPTVLFWLERLPSPMTAERLPAGSPAVTFRYVGTGASDAAGRTRTPGARVLHAGPYFVIESAGC
jgi:hypothetical protein